MSEIKNYEVIPNGFWGEPEVIQGITREYIQEAVEYVFRENQDRQFTAYTGLEGIRAFNTAVQDLVLEESREANEALWTSARPLLVGEPEPVMEYPGRNTTEFYLHNFLNVTLDSPTVASLNAPLEPPNTQRIRQGTTDTQEIHAQGLRNGDITLVEYLDLISEQ